MVNSPILNALYKLDIQRYSYDLYMKAYMEGRISDMEISIERDRLTEVEDNFRELVLAVEEENRNLRGI